MTQEQWSMIRYFKAEEFDSPDAPGSGEIMDFDFVTTLDKIRSDFGQPIHINSGVRSAKHNEEVGGVESSAHTEGHAADITIFHRVPGIVSFRRARIVMLAIVHGIKRIGIGKNFVHLDNSPTHPSPRIWLY